MTLYNYDDIFVENGNELVMTIPDEIIDQVGWLPGVILTIRFENDKLYLKKL